MKDKLHGMVALLKLNQNRIDSDKLLSSYRLCLFLEKWPNSSEMLQFLNEHIVWMVFFELFMRAIFRLLIIV